MLRLPLILLLQFIFILPFLSAAELNQDQLRVGVIIPLSGELGYFGQAFRYGVDLAIAEQSEELIKVIFEDDKSGDRKLTISAARALIDQHKIHVVIVTGMPSVVVLDPIINSSSILALSAWDSNKAIEKLSKNTFGFGFSNEKTGQELADYARSKLSLKKLAIVSAHDEWSELISTAFARHFEKEGGTIVSHDRVGLDDTDFNSLILRIKQRGAEGVYFPLYRASLISFTKQITLSNFKGRLLSAEGMTLQEVKQLGPKSERMLITQARVDDADFQKKIESHYGGLKEEFNLAHAALGYDAINFLYACLLKLKEDNIKLDSHSLREVFYQIDYPGILGMTHFSDTKSTDRGQQIMIVKNGKILPLE